jgi:hypothetical protein
MDSKNSGKAHSFVADYFVNTSLGRVAKRDSTGNVSFGAVRQTRHVQDHDADGVFRSGSQSACGVAVVAMVQIPASTVARPTRPIPIR